MLQMHLGRDVDLTLLVCFEIHFTGDQTFIQIIVLFEVYPSKSLIFEDPLISVSGFRIFMTEKSFIGVVYLRLALTFAPPDSLLE